MKDQERERLERVERFKLEMEAKMVPMSEHLIAPKNPQPHCDFYR